MKKFLSMTLALSMLMSLAAVAVSAEGGFATREYAINEFVEVAKQNWQESGSANGFFKDYDSISNEYKSNIDAAYINGMVVGYEDKTLRPKENIRRIEALAMLSRCLGDAILNNNAPLVFNDVPEWAKTAIDRLSSAGIVNGYGDGRLGSNDLLTVEQVALLTERVRFNGEEAPEYPSEDEKPVTNKSKLGYSMTYEPTSFYLENTGEIDKYTYLTAEKLDAPVYIAVQLYSDMDAKTLADGLVLQSGLDNVLTDTSMIGSDEIPSQVVFYEKEENGITQNFTFHAVNLDKGALLIEAVGYTDLSMQISDKIEQMFGSFTLNK